MEGSMKDLVRNPIGIVALFISLIYAFANLLLGATVSSLTEQERYPLILFIVLFPVVVLGVFYRLVSKHHGKLYAPGDYKDDQSFLRTLSAQERQEKLESEVAEALPDQNLISAEPISNEQPAQSGKVTRAFTTDAVPSNLSRLYDDIRQTEAAALRHLEKEFGPTEARDIGIGETGVSFDALLKSREKPVFAEVKIMRSPTSGFALLDKVLYSAVVAEKFMNGRFKLILLVVYRFDKEELPKVENMWRRKIEKCPADIELRFVPYSELEV